jgi:hypothetical protein
MIRPTTSVTTLAATAATALFVITLSAEAASGATAMYDKTPPTSVAEASATAEPTPLVADPGAGVAAAAAAEARDGLELNYTPVTPVEAVLPDSSGRPPHRRRSCRCSCGYPCETAADCGGSSCDPFITCC